MWLRSTVILVSPPVLMRSDYGAHDPAGGHDLITLADGRYHLLLPLPVTPLWANEHEVENQDHGSHVQEQHEPTTRPLPGDHHNCQ
jgi:hypothetical protein